MAEERDVSPAPELDEDFVERGMVRGLNFDYMIWPGTIEITKDMVPDTKVVVIPDSVQRIANEAFLKCSNLEEVIFGAGLVHIGDRAFQECKSLTAVNIPMGLETVGKDAFNYCEKLSSVVFPDSTHTLGSGLFTRCRELSEFTIPPLVTRIPDKMISYAKFETFVIPDTVMSMGIEAFGWCRNLTSVELSQNLSEIPESTFFHAGLREIVIPNKVKSIGQYAFAYCEHLRLIKLPPSVQNMQNSFFRNYGLRTIILPLGFKALNGAWITSCFDEPTEEELAEDPAIKKLSQEDRLTFDFYGAADDFDDCIRDVLGMDRAKHCTIIVDSIKTVELIAKRLNVVEFERSSLNSPLWRKLQKNELKHERTETFQFYSVRTLYYNSDIHIRNRTPADKRTAYEEDGVAPMALDVVHQVLLPVGTFVFKSAGAIEGVRSVEPPGGGPGKAS